MPTIQQIIDDAKIRYRHTYSDPTVIGWLDAVHKRIWKMVPRDTMPIPLTLTGAGVYVLPPSVSPRHIKAVRIGPSTGPFAPLDYRDVHEYDGAGYAISDNNIIVSEPEPVVGVTNYLFIYYDKTIPTPLTSVVPDTRPDLPEEWHEALTVGLLEMIAAARKDVKMKNNFAGEFALLMGEYSMEAIDNDPEYPSCKDELPRRARYGSSVDD